MLSLRERRTITLGVAVSAIAISFAYGILPVAQQWQAREAIITAESIRLAELRGLLASEERLEDAVLSRSELLESEPRRLLAGRTPALAAASLQSILQSYADRSYMTVSRLDVVGAPESTDRAYSLIPATLSAVGDIHGVTELLVLIQYGSLQMEVQELIVRPNPALRGDLLQVTLTLRVPYVGG